MDMCMHMFADGGNWAFCVTQTLSSRVSSRAPPLSRHVPRVGASAAAPATCSPGGRGAL